MRFFARPAWGMYRRPENLPIHLQGTEPLSASAWHRSRSHHMRDNISAAIFVHTAHDKHRHADNSAIYTNFFIQCVHPKNRVHRIGRERLRNSSTYSFSPFVISLIWLLDRFSMPRLCASFSIFSSGNALHEGFLHYLYEHLFTALALCDEERNVAALTNLVHHEVHRAHSGIQTARTITAAVVASSVRALTFLCAQLLIDLGLHQLCAQPFQHTQHRIRLRHTLQ